MPRKAAAAAPTEGEETQARRSTRLAAQPKKDEPAAPKPAAKRAPAKKRAVDADEKEGEEKAPAAKKSRAGAKKAEAEEEESSPTPELSPIDLGDSLPSVTLKNEKGEDVDVATLTADKGLVLFLVPKADTPGCTNQACGFRDSYPDFTSSRYEVYCLSADSPTAQTKWQTKKELPYPLLSDPKRVLISALGAGEGGKTKRSHFIFEKGGKLVDKKNPVKPVDSPKLALEFIQSHSS
ncbi:hypothetical protein QCA50_007133 [Cerrena zonata]|uniref:thioredoxin-dependent peroxiredoxin n=1 Tax=Cerrena zonata TaxID=2478898 RepID=A0AAW0GCT3_9APHY